VYKLRKFSY